MYAWNNPRAVDIFNRYFASEKLCWHWDWNPRPLDPAALHHGHTFLRPLVACTVGPQLVVITLGYLAAQHNRKFMLSEKSRETRGELTLNRLSEPTTLFSKKGSGGGCYGYQIANSWDFLSERKKTFEITFFPHFISVLRCLRDFRLTWSDIFQSWAVKNGER